MTGISLRILADPDELTGFNGPEVMRFSSSYHAENGSEARVFPDHLEIGFCRRGKCRKSATLLNIFHLIIRNLWSFYANTFKHSLRKRL
jgi:hypothetical protein